MSFIIIAAFLLGICWADEWQARTPMPTARGYLSSVEIGGKIYVIGGDSTGSGTVVATNEMYDPATDSWTTKAPMLTARALPGIAEVNGKIYVIGGTTGGPVLNTNEEYDTLTDSWTTKAAMPTARCGAGAVSVNGKIYVIGGHPGYGHVDKVEEYDPVTNTWSTKTPMPTSRAYLGVAEMDGKIYAVGGISGPIPGWYNVATNEMYDPVANSWTAKAPMSTTRHNLLVAELNGKVYAIGGWKSGSSSVLNINEEYDLSTDSWITKTPMSTARIPAGAEVNGKIYAIGGFGSSGPLDINEEYSPTVEVAEKENGTLHHSSIYALPNPFIDYLKILCPDLGNVCIYDISGKKVGQVNNGIWNGRNSEGKEVQAGTYFLISEGYNPVKVIKLK